MRKWALLGISSALLLQTSHAAWAQSSAKADNVEEIVVTPLFRAQSIDTVPLSITALSADDLARGGVVGFTDYAAMVPNLSFSYAGSGVHGSRSVAIRGVVGNETTGFYIDETPVFESLDPRVIDLDRIEVLRGPQGTLYGARSMGGTVRLITHQPDVNETELKGHARLSETEHGGTNYGVDALINLPIVPGHIAVRGFVYREENSGVLDRVPGVAPVLAAYDPTIMASSFNPQENVDDEQVTGASISVRGEFLGGHLVITPRFQYQRTQTGNLPFDDYRAGNHTLARLFNIPEPGEDVWRHYSLAATYQSHWGEFVSATAYFRRSTADREDYSELAALLFGIPPTPAVIRRHVSQKRFVQELRFVSDLTGPLNFTMGAFYSDTKQFSQFPANPIEPYFSNVFSQVIDKKVTEAAVFGEATYKLTDALSFIAGARWFDNKVDFNAADAGLITANETYAGVQKESKITPKFGINWTLPDNTLLYASAAQGFRIGGVNSYSPTLCASDLAGLPSGIKTYNSDSLWSYEAGAKGRFFGRGLHYSASAFVIDWSNVQQMIALSSCGFATVINAGAAKIKGFELSLDGAVADALSYTVSLGYADSKITDNGGFVAIPVGARLQQVPEWTLATSLNYDFKAWGRDSFLRFDYTFTGESNSANNSSLATPRRRASYGFIDLRAGIQFDNMELDLFAKNLTDAAANYSDIPPLAAELPTRPRIVTNQPRTIGAEIRIAH
jgi:outer membrane receptor protein involved in Fe transport